MKSEYVLAALERFANGDRDGAMGMVRSLAANETKSVHIAKRLRRIAETASQFIRLAGAPSGLGFTEPTRTLDSLILADDVRAAVAQTVREWQSRERLQEHGLTPRCVLLLRGPSGNGKTALAEAIAQAVGLPFALVRYDNVIASHLGETGAHVTKLLEYVRMTPCVLLFDEADAIVTARTYDNQAASRECNLTVNQLLMGLDRLEGRSLIIFATNFAEVIDSALLRRTAATLDLLPPQNGQTEALASLLRTRWPVLGDWRFQGEPTSFAAVEMAAMDEARRIVLSDERNPA